jgi:hypothetical protein
VKRIVIFEFSLLSEKFSKKNKQLMEKDEKFSETLRYFLMSDSVRYFYADRNEKYFVILCMRTGAFSGKLVKMYR